MKKITFETLGISESVATKKTVTGYALANHDLDLAMYKAKYSLWCAVELTTGLALAYGTTRVLAIEEVCRVIAKIGLPSIREKITTQLERYSLITK